MDESRVQAWIDDEPQRVQREQFNFDNVSEQFQRHKLSFKMKIGQHGSEPGQFLEPSGLTATRNNLLAAVDSNNHRVQIFKLNGDIVQVFGDTRSENTGSQLHYPNRIAISPINGCFYITERPPLKMVQMFDENYNFIRSFAEGQIQHPRAICVDNEGNVIVLQGLVMTVTIFSPEGEFINQFSCLGETGENNGVAFPTAMCVNNDREIFVADNNKHSIFVYSYRGKLKRVICPGQKFIYFPIGLAMNQRDELVVFDNHETFNITIMTQDGIPIRGFQSQVKHSGVFDCCLVDNGRSVAMSCRDYKVYVYNFELTNGKIPQPKRFSQPGRNRNKAKVKKIPLMDRSNNIMTTEN